MKYIIARPIDGITLNGNEYALDENGDVLKFESEQDALNFLFDAGYPDEESIEDEGIMIITEELACVLDVELEDDDTEDGGTSFAGETVRDFLDGETNITLEELNEELMASGIRPINIETDRFTD